MKRVLFILPSLKAGGAERVVSFLAKNLNKELFEVKLIILGFEKDSVYNTDGVDVVYLNKGKLSRSMKSIFRCILQDKPSIVFSSIGHVNLVMGLMSIFFKRVKFIAREASVISVMNQYANRRFKIPTNLTRYVYSRFEKIVCQSVDMRNDLITNFKLPSSKLEVIGNPITGSDGDVVPLFLDERKVDVRFITVGRISPEKGYERILKALSKITDCTYSYLIIGRGDIKSIKELASNFGIEQNINHIEYTDKILEYMKGSDFFIQGSYVEGFPNALLESCSVGVPVIAYNCPGGTKEIVSDGINGYLIDNDSIFENVLSKLGQDNRLFDEVLIKHSVYSKFSSEIILSKYEKLFLSV